VQYPDYDCKPSQSFKFETATTEKALDYVLRAISLFESELEREKRGFYAEDSFSESSSSRTGARLYYLAGGILLGMGRHEEAVGKLSKAAKYSHGWQQLELAVRRMLIECYEKHIPSHSDTNESSDTLASMILDSYFNAEMSSTELRQALGHFLSISGGESLKWFHDAVDDEDDSLPFSFAVSFPGKTHATAGDSVQASVLIRSNLDYAVHVKSAVLLSLAGQLHIPMNDLLSATNASECSEDGIIIQAKTAIIVSTEVELPKDLSIIASDDSGNGGEEQGIAGKGSFAKSARPRSAGITAAGGARLVSEEKLDPAYRQSQSQGWSLNFLGGKPLLCDGLQLVFYPVQAEKASSENVTLIELNLKKKKPRTAANIKRTPFEEENYVASAWSRPLYLPLSRGPRSLRVSEPMPHLTVTNLTDELTEGKAIEGTVNRVLLKLQAGSMERCFNIKISISCFSVLVTPSGSTKRLVSEEELTPEGENSIDMKNPQFRSPVLVCPGEMGPDSAPNGYDLPAGWVAAGSGQKHADIPIPSLQGGECSYIHLDMFRPAATLQTDIVPSETMAIEDLVDFSICKTDLYVTVSYRQERPASKKLLPSKRRSRRPVPRPLAMSTSDDSQQPEDTEATAEEETCDDVSLEYTNSVMWTQPLTASFAPGPRKNCPSGSRHPTNAVEEDPEESDVEFSLVHGQDVAAKCTLRLDSAMGSLQAEVVSVGFKVCFENPK
jgi:hypothetical protein